MPQHQYFQPLTNFLAVFLGGGLGSVTRWGLAALLTRSWGGPFPLGTMAVNVSGCFLIGAVIGFTGADERVVGTTLPRLFLAVGFLGGYTTFSTFSLETITLLRSGNVPTALANVLLAFLLCLAAVWVGQATGMNLNGRFGA